MPRKPPTERDLRAAVYGIARMYLEVERGLRPPDHLRRILAPSEYRRHRDQPMETRHPRAGPVMPDDIGGMQIERSLRGQVAATVTTREFGDRWGALTIHFKEQPDGWVVDSLERLHRRGLDVEQRPTRPDPEADDKRIRLVTMELRSVASARRATEVRLGELMASDVEPSSSDLASAEQLREQAGRWVSREHELYRELDALTRTRELRDRFVDGSTPSPPEQDTAAPTPNPVAERLERVLGERPESPEARQLWDEAREAVQSYRELWDVDDTSTLLGPEPDYAGQRRDRERVVSLLRRNADALREMQPSIEREREARRDLHRPFGIEL